MDVEFHYHITYILARKAGFNPDDAAVIAYAAEYTDDNNDKYKVSLPDNGEYRNYISQTLNISWPKNKLVRIYTCFHFPAGDFLDHRPARRADGALHLFNTTPNSPHARAMFDEALASKNLYRIGIAAHGYADSWAHQNFIGFRHAFGRGKGLLAWVTPTIGHADFRSQPDRINLRWQDRRLLKPNQTCRNKERFLEAAQKIFLAFANHKGLDKPNESWKQLRDDLSQAIAEECTSAKASLRGRPHRLAAYRRLCPEIPEYDSRAWLNKALVPLTSPWRRIGDWLWRKCAALPGLGPFLKAYWPQALRVRRFRSRPGFEKSHWHQFQDAVKAHQRFMKELQVERYEQLGDELREVF